MSEQKTSASNVTVASDEPAHEQCEYCHGRGWYPSVDANGDQDGEAYCSCAAGVELARKDGAA